MNRTTLPKAVLMAGLVAVLLAPGAAAQPVDVFLFPITPVPPPAGPCNAGITSPPCYMLDPVIVAGATGTVGATVVGAGVCNDILYETCFAFPAWNPNWSPGPGGPVVGAVPTFWWCEVTFHTTNWGGAPIFQSIQAHIVYDGPGPKNDVLSAGDLVFSTVAGPLPPPPFPPPLAPRAGQWTGGMFGPYPGGPNLPVGAIVHVIITDPQLPTVLPDLPPTRDTVVTCWIW